MDMRVKSRAGSTRRAETGVKTINLALQGGAHGAFAWGVLDRLIEDGRVDFEGICATSAGAMNAAVLAHGWNCGGPDGAREALQGFWKAVSEAAATYSPYKALPWAKAFGQYALENSPAYQLMDMATRLYSPYQLNPMNFNALRDVLEQHVDFAALRATSKIKLYLCATNVETGKVRIFTCDDITPDAVLASACLPFMFHGKQPGRKEPAAARAVPRRDVGRLDGGALSQPACFDRDAAALLRGRRDDGLGYLADPRRQRRLDPRRHAAAVAVRVARLCNDVRLDRRRAARAACVGCGSGAYVG